MTGYGRAVATTKQLELTVEISSVNRRNLETQVSTPKEWMGLDRILTDQIRKAAHRGKVYLQLKVKDYSMDEGLSLDQKLISEEMERLKALAKTLQINYEPDLRLLVELIDLLKQGAALPDWTSIQELIEETAAQAIGEWTGMRESEGSVLLEDSRMRVAELERIVSAIESHAEVTADEHREKLMERLRSAGLDLDVEDERVLKEIALFADRCDVSEEITRLKSHFSQMKTTLEADGPVGRKLDFILQEVYREFNTIGSKSNNLEVSRYVIEGKNLWEQLREQAANVE